MPQTAPSMFFCGMGSSAPCRAFPHPVGEEAEYAATLVNDEDEDMRSWRAAVEEQRPKFVAVRDGDLAGDLRDEAAAAPLQAELATCRGAACRGCHSCRGAPSRNTSRVVGRDANRSKPDQSKPDRSKSDRIKSDRSRKDLPKSDLSKSGVVKEKTKERDAKAQTVKKQVVLTEQEKKLALKAEKLKEIGVRMAKVMEDSKSAAPNTLVFSKTILAPCAPPDQGLVTQERAHAGRTEKMQVSAKHFVLGNSTEGPWPSNCKTMVFGNGCFWGSEKGIWRLPFGIHTTAVGYVGGFTPNPTYEEVCSGRTGHTEAVQVVFDPSRLSVVDLLRWFWESHDPTQGMGQGNDRGTQYRSALYFHGDEQRQLFEASKAAYESALKKVGRGRGSVTTEVGKTSVAAYFPQDKVFYYAEDHHQQYLAKPHARPYCSAEPLQVSMPSYESWVPRGFTSEQKALHAPKLPEEFWAKYGPIPHSVIRAPNKPIVWPACE